jgi:hypothetical protein
LDCHRNDLKDFTMMHFSRELAARMLVELGDGTGRRKGKEDELAGADQPE